MDPTKRFSSRVENYVKYRPTYPPQIVELLRDACDLTPASIIADLGSGTGLLAQLFLANGNRVLGIEPNQDMREAGERLLAHEPNFISVDGAAEATTLPAVCVDFVTAGQAFHWFDIAATRAECQRILKPNGWAVLVWNTRVTEATPFLRDYEALLNKHSDDYARVNHQDAVTDEALNAFFGSGWRKAAFDNAQVFDYDGLKGRLLSSSYAPDAGHPNHAPMLRDLRVLFDAHQHDGAVSFLYKTEVYYGRL